MTCIGAVCTAWMNIEGVTTNMHIDTCGRYDMRTCSCTSTSACTCTYVYYTYVHMYVFMHVCTYNKYNRYINVYVCFTL